MKKTSPILRRLPVYLHYLKNDNKDRVSSRELALALGFTEILVRKDLASVSDGGMRKLGHYRQRLIGDIEQFLSFDSPDSTEARCNDLVTAAFFP